MNRSITKNRGLSFVLAVAMVFTMFAGGLSVTTETSYATDSGCIDINGVKVNMAGAEADATTYYYYDGAATATASAIGDISGGHDDWYIEMNTSDKAVTIHLNNAELTTGVGINVPEYDIQMELIGNCTIAGIYDGDLGECGYGIMSNQNLTIYGYGSLYIGFDVAQADAGIYVNEDLIINNNGTVTLDLEADDTWNSDKFWGIYSCNGRNVTFSSNVVSLDINMNLVTDGESCFGVDAYADDSVLSVECPCNINMNAGSGSVTGLNSSNNINILSTANEVNITGEAYSQSIGINAGRNLDVQAPCNIDQRAGYSEAYGMYAWTSLVLEAPCNITASGLNQVYGLFSGNNITVNDDCTLNVSTDANALYYGVFGMYGGNINLEGDDDIIINFGEGLYTPRGIYSDSKPVMITGSGVLNIDASKASTEAALWSIASTTTVAIGGTRNININMSNLFDASGVYSEGTFYNVGSGNIDIVANECENAYCFYVHAGEFQGSGDINFDCSDSSAGYLIMGGDIINIAGSGDYTVTAAGVLTTAIGVFTEGPGSAINVSGSGKLNLMLPTDIFSAGFAVDCGGCNITGSREISIVAANAGIMTYSNVTYNGINIGGDVKLTIVSSNAGIDGGADINIIGNPTVNITDDFTGILANFGNIYISGAAIKIVDNNEWSPACCLETTGEIVITGSSLDLYSKGAYIADLNGTGDFTMTDSFLKGVTETTFSGIYAIGRGGSMIDIEDIHITGNTVRIGDTLAAAQSATPVLATDPAITTAKAIIVTGAGTGGPDPSPRSGGSKTPVYDITENGQTPEVAGTSSTPTGGTSNNNPAQTVNKGDVKISTKSATPGQKVTVTVTEGIGFVLDDLTIKTKDGKELTAVDNGDGTFTFVMPSGEVDIEPTFTPDPKVLEKYQDVNPDEYYYQPVAWADKKGITTGVDSKNFGIDEGCSRAQLVTFLWRMNGCPIVNGGVKFSDVKAGSYYEQAVAWAASQGFVKGFSDIEFAPDKIVNRSQTVAIMARMAGVADNATGYSQNFQDVAASAYYSNAVAWASQNGITSGRSATKFAPEDDCFRQELITFLFRFDN